MCMCKYIYIDARILKCTVLYEYNLSKPLQQNVYFKNEKR